MTEISLEFWFDAAHHFLHEPEGHPYRALHGHSFRAEVVLRGEPDPVSGFVADFAVLEAACQSVRTQLDHRFLNDIEALRVPSLENIARFIFEQLQPGLGKVARVTLHRDSCRQACTYYGPD